MEFSKTVKNMIISPKRRKRRVSNCDPKKEKIINELSSALLDAGFEVRRERLKQGYGWKALSGACCLDKRDLIFVDRKLPQDEQISFLAAKIVALQVAVKLKKLPNVPDKIKQQLNVDTSNNPESVISSETATHSTL